MAPGQKLGSDAVDMVDAVGAKEAGCRVPLAMGAAVLKRWYCCASADMESSLERSAILRSDK